MTVALRHFPYYHRESGTGSTTAPLQFVESSRDRNFSLNRLLPTDKSKEPSVRVREGEAPPDPAVLVLSSISVSTPELVVVDRDSEVSQ